VAEQPALAMMTRIAQTRRGSRCYGRLATEVIHSRDPLTLYLRRARITIPRLPGKVTQRSRIIRSRGFPAEENGGVMAAIAFFTGPAHLFEDSNAEFVALAPNPPMIGVPAAEQLIGFPAIHAAMREAYDTGEPRLVILPTGRLTVVPRLAHGRVFGVVTCFRFQPAPLPRSPRDPQPEPIRRAG
jgi:hypothetical protein